MAGLRAKIWTQDLMNTKSTNNLAAMFRWLWTNLFVVFLSLSKQMLEQ
jgi:hypothetical protein